MGTYNTLHTSLDCPRCSAHIETSVDCHFGYTTGMAQLRPGDRYPWMPGRQPGNGGRPARGTVDGEAYMECPRCGKDSFLLVSVREDVIVGVRPDGLRRGYIPD